MTTDLFKEKTLTILGIDSAAQTATAALVNEERTIASFTMDHKKTHSQTLLVMIDEMMKVADQDVSSIDAVAVTNGPGSFTGLRIGAATAKGITLALDKPVIPVPTTAAMAYVLYGMPGLICPIMDARRNQVFTGLYRFVLREEDHGYVMETVKEQQALDMKEWIGRLNTYGEPVTFTGDAVTVQKDAIAELMQVPYVFAPAHKNRARAEAVAAYGLELFKAGVSVSSDELSLDYLRVSQAEREKAEREKTGEVFA